MEHSQSLYSPTHQLLCKENVVSLDEMGEFDSVLEDGFDDDEYILALLDREIKIQDFSQNSTILRARLDGIQYILRIRDVLGFKLQTAYTSINYVDRFLSRRCIDEEKSWAIRLLSMGCISLAAKMEEIEVPQLSSFCLDDYNFESISIQRMELFILHTLDWKMGAITPFCFIQFFANKFFGNSVLRSGVISRIVEVILAATKDVKIMCHKASVIAASSILIVMDQELTREKLELKFSHLTSYPCIKILQEDIVCCYYLLQEIRVKSSKEMKTPDLSQSAETYGSCSVVTSAASAKRKRLIFNADDDVAKNGKKP